MRRTVIAIILVGIFAAPAMGAEEFLERVSTDWYEMWYLGERCGYARDYVNRVRLDGREVWKIYREGVSFREGGSGKQKTVSENLDYYSPDFTLIRSLYVLRDGGQVKVTEVIVTGNRADVTVSLEGRSISYSVRIEPGTVITPFGFQLSMLGHLIAESTVSIPVLVPELRMVVREKIRFESVESRDNGSITVIPSCSTRPDLVGLLNYTEYGLDGTEYVLTQAGASIVRTTREAALAPLPERSCDVDIRVDAARNDYLNISDFAELTFLINVEGVENASRLFESHAGSAFQNDSVFTLTSLFVWEAEREEISDDVKIYLEPSLRVQSDAPEFRDALRRILGDEELPAVVVAELLSEWLRRSVRTDPDGPQAKTALAMLRDLSGDCSEYATLFVALCRAAGIPARCVLGYVLDGEFFLYHQWAEIYSGGEWVLCDPTRYYVNVPPAYLAVCGDPEDRPGVDPVYKAVAVQGRTSIRLLHGTLMDETIIDFTRPKEGKYPPFPKRKKHVYEPFPERKNTIYPPIPKPKRRRYEVSTTPEWWRGAPLTEPEQWNYPRMPTPMLPSSRLRGK